MRAASISWSLIWVNRVDSRPLQAHPLKASDQTFQSAGATRSKRASCEDRSRYQPHLAPRTLAAATRSVGQEILDQPREFRRLLHLGHETAILNHDKPR